MLGLRTQESDGFNKFFEIVQNAASAKRAVFFLDCGEGREKQIGHMEAEDLGGWLIPMQDAKRFEPKWLSFDEDQTDEFDGMYRFAVWSEHNGNVTIKFEEP